MSVVKAGRFQTAATAASSCDNQTEERQRNRPLALCISVGHSCEPIGRRVTNQLGTAASRSASGGRAGEVSIKECPKSSPRLLTLTLRDAGESYSHTIIRVREG